MEYILDCNYFYWKLLWGESQIQFREDMECILGCNSLSLKNSAVERVRYSSTRIWNVFLDRNYLLLRNSAGESQIQFHRERESALDCNYLFLKSSSGERVKYSSTGIWNVFDCNYLLIEGSAGERIKYSSTGIWNIFLDCIYLLLKTLLEESQKTVPQGYGMYFRL